MTKAIEIKNWMKVCPNCEYVGKATENGSFALEVVLWLCFLFPGLIYSMWRIFSCHTVCPQCKEKGMIPITTPKGQKLVAHYTETPDVSSQIPNKKNTSKSAQYTLYATAAVWGGLGISIIANAFFTGALMIVSAASLLPQIKKKYHVKNFTAASLAIVSLILGIIYISQPSASPQSNDVQTVPQRDLATKAGDRTRVAFANDPDKILQNIKTYADAKNWGMVKITTTPLLNTENVEIKTFHEQAVKELKVIKDNREKQERKKKAEKYVEFLETQIKDLENYNIDQFLKDKTTIIIAAAFYSAMAMHLDEAHQHDLSDKQKRVIDRFKRALLKRQKIDFPKLRDAYGPQVRKTLWVEDMTAKTFGSGYRNIEFIGKLFVTNKNISVFHIGVQDTLKGLRFKQVRYKWSKHVGEYQYFDFDVPSDTDIAILENDSYRVIK